ncbi:hypothetical protein ACLI09_08945 [Flavobacterium sp. RHBU_24]|uniref:hypothetical protein n=1 Tax=Flavobacterium sp. RHBU_24 TaxID=3391185 RepID=UPI00398551DF
MKASIKYYIIAALLFIFSMFLIISSVKAKDINTVPFEGTVEKAESSDISGYDYFKLSGGYVVPYGAYYEIEEPGNTVKQIVYPLVSRAYLDKAHNAYRPERDDVFASDDFINWYQTYKVRPKFYIQAEAEDMSETNMMNTVLADTLEKNIEGTRIKSLFSMGDNIVSGFKSQGITIENSVFIDEAANPAQDIETANIVLGIGIFIAFVSLVLFLIGKRKAAKQKNTQDLIQRY